MSSSTGIGSGEQFPTGRWPDQLAHDPNTAVFRESVSNNVQIEPLNHLQFFLFDQDGGEPYTMNVTLPIIERLPGQGRMYLFYVSRCHAGDQMVFKVVPGGGNTVNGDLIQHSFTLDGRKTLFFAVGLNGDYLIHPFSGSEPGPPTPSGLPPTVQYNLSPIAAPDFAFELEDYGDFNGVGLAITPPTFTLSLTNVVSGMEGYLTENVPVPTQNFSAFRCEQSGYYNVTPNIEWFVQWAPPDVPVSSFANYLFFKEYNPLGINTFGYYYTSSGTQVVTPDPMTGFLATISSPQLIYMQAGYFYMCQMVYHGDPAGSLPIPFYSGRSGTITFQYYGLGAAIPPLLMAARRQENEPGGGDGVVSWTPWSKSKTTKHFTPPTRKEKEEEEEDKDVKIESAIVVGAKKEGEGSLEVRKKKQLSYLREMEKVQAEKKKAEKEMPPHPPIPPPSVSLRDIEKVFSRMVDGSKKRKRD